MGPHTPPERVHVSSARLPHGGRVPRRVNFAVICARQAEKGLPRNKHKAHARLVEGAVVQNWKQAFGALSLRFPDRLGPYLC